MIRRTAPLALTLFALLVPASLPLGALRAAGAAETVADTALGARIQSSLASGDVAAFRVSLLVGTALRVRLASSSGGDGSGSGGPGKGGDSTALPQVVALDPHGVEIGRIYANANDLLATIAMTGTYRFEVRAGTYSGAYELRVEGTVPTTPTQSSSLGVVVSAAPVAVHVAAPVGSSVEIEVDRVSGGAPHVDSVTDGLGRALSVFVRDARSDRVRLYAIPVGAAGGIDVTISAQGGGSGSYSLRTQISSVTDRPPGGDDKIARRLVCQLRPGADAASVAAALGDTLVEADGNLVVLRTAEGHEGEEDEDANEAETSSDVISAEPEVFANLPEGSQANAAVVGSTLGRADVETQTALRQMHAGAAQRIETGAGVVVAVLDGGVDSAHPFLTGHVLAGRDFVDGDNDPSEEKNGLDDDGDGLIDEGYGHGTFVASLIVAAAPDAKILPVRVLDTDGRGRSSSIAFGITWAVEHGANVLNLSFGTLGGNQAIATAVRYALARGVSVVCSTGNDGSSTVMDFPAAMPGVISVTALDAAGRRAKFANGGTTTTLAAPGVDIIGAYPVGRYATWSGTSFSAAFVSGAAALLLEAAPAAPPARIASTLVRRAQPFRRAVPRAGRRFLGAGVLDLNRLVR